MMQSALVNLAKQSSRANGVLFYHTSRPLLAGGEWRRKNGLPRNPNAYGSLTDLPDYTFLDGRRTPAGQGKLKRAQEQNELAAKIIKLTGEVDFAVQLDLDRKQAEEARKEQILSRKLKSKGDQTPILSSSSTRSS